jgi:hypothetical protein
MVIGQRIGLPTLNGYSGWAPPGWQLEPGPGYDERARAWSRAKRLPAGLCRLDLNTNRWERTD